MCRFRYYNPRASWVLKLIRHFLHSVTVKLQSTCIVGTKTDAQGITIPAARTLQSTCIVGTKTMEITAHSGARHYNPRASWVLKRQSTVQDVCLFYYNPRASWVLKPDSFAYIAAIKTLQSTCIVGTKTCFKFKCVHYYNHYNPRASWVLKQYDHRYMLAINIEMKKLYFKMAIKKRH